MTNMQPQQSHELPPIVMPEQGQMPQTENGYAIPISEKPASQVAELSRPQPQQFGSISSGSATVQAAQLDPASPTVTRTSTPEMADDVDLIEKEWVHKAKEIVARTKDDPRQQNQEMNRVKADYLKKRYDKDIKLDET